MIAADVQVRRALSGMPDSEMAYDDLVADNLLAAYRELERTTRIKFAPTVVVTRPGEDLTLGTDYDLGEDYYDISGFGAGRVQIFTTRWRPIISVATIALEAAPERRILALPNSWFRINHKLGTIALVPLVGSIAYTGVGFDVWLPMLYGGYLQGVMPQFARIDYTAGLPLAAWDTTATDGLFEDYAEVRRAVGQLAAINTLHSVPELIATSGSVDGGTMQAMDLGQHIDRLQKQVDNFINVWGKPQAPVPIRFA